MSPHVWLLVPALLLSVRVLSARVLSGGRREPGRETAAARAARRRVHRAVARSDLRFDPPHLPEPPRRYGPDRPPAKPSLPGFAFEHEGEYFRVPDRLPAVLEGRVLGGYFFSHCCGDEESQVEGRHCTACDEVTAWPSAAGGGWSIPPSCAVCGGTRTRTVVPRSERSMPLAELAAVLGGEG